MLRPRAGHAQATRGPIAGHALALLRRRAGGRAQGRAQAMLRPYPDHAHKAFRPGSGHVPATSRPCPGRAQAVPR
eukprot:11190338-Lingulodinium_polyedra.AAC.1